ncbi:MAG TPA: ABC transporter ATP-binding protein [Flavisolibacter sp.]|nr:ABC transporter ATP-binding protein [Flavisolibacter sp.]
MVSANNLVKKYVSGKSEIIAVKDLSFEVEQGELFGIIGPDGAGKTSLIRMLISLLLPDGGSAMVAGYDVIKDYKELRKKTGYMPGRFSLYQDLTVRENLQFFATIFNTSIEENYDLVKDIYIQIEPFKDRKAGKLSGGMKQKLALCCALIHRPEILFLDEPTTGVDAVSRTEFWQMLKRLKEENITILVSTPYMDEASLCDRIALMQEGRFMITGTPQEIINSFEQDLLAIRSDDMHHLTYDLKNASYVDNAYSFGAYVHTSMKPGYNPEQLKNYLDNKGHKNIDIEKVKPDIEDCFLKLMR